MNSVSSNLSGTRFIFPVILGTTMTLIDRTLPSLKSKDNSLDLHSYLFGSKVTTDSLTVGFKDKLSPFGSFSVIYDLWLPESRMKQTDTVESSCEFFTVFVAGCINT